MASLFLCGSIKGLPQWQNSPVGQKRHSISAQFLSVTKITILLAGQNHSLCQCGSILVLFISQLASHLLFPCSEAGTLLQGPKRGAKMGPPESWEKVRRVQEGQKTD